MKNACLYDMSIQMSVQMRHRRQLRTLRDCQLLRHDHLPKAHAENPLGNEQSGEEGNQVAADEPGDMNLERLQPSQFPRVDRFGHIWVHRNPNAQKNGRGTAPYDAEQRPVLRGVVLRFEGCGVTRRNSVRSERVRHVKERACI